jgi:predicted DNA-binding transcriptional regulator YafY
VGSLWYLVAWDPSKDDWRTFRLDRIESVEPTKERFKARPPPGDDVVEYVARSISSSPHAHRAKVLLRAAMADVRPRVGPFDGLFESVSDTTCTMELGAPTLDVLVSRLLWLGVEFEIVRASDELRQHLLTVAERLARASARPGAPPGPWSAATFPAPRADGESSGSRSAPTPRPVVPGRRTGRC